MSLQIEFETLLAWFEHLIHHHQNGTLPPAPVVGGPAVIVAAAPVPAPVAAPAPIAPAPVAPVVEASPAPAAVFGMDADGFVYPAEFNGTPIEGYGIITGDQEKAPNTTVQQKNNISKNLNQNFTETLTVDGKYDPMNYAAVSQARNFNLPPYAIGGNYPQVDKGIVFRRGNQLDPQHDPGFHLSDIPAFVANCHKTGNWPINKHETGQVAS